MLIEGSRAVPPVVPRAAPEPSQDATVPDAEISDGAKKRPKPKSKLKPPAKGSSAGAEQPKEEEATSLRITPTHYGKEASARMETTLDMFNLSHDEYYSTGMGRNRVRHKTSKALVVHSTPASKLSLVSTHLTSVDLQHFHCPRGTFAPGVSFRVAVVTKDRHTNGKPKKTLNRVDIMKHKSDLSAREGRVIFAEYMEERPPLLENVGMGTRICNFYRKKSPDDTPILSVSQVHPSYHIISYHIISYHIISYHIISYHIISYHIISYHIISYHIISYHIISYHTPRLLFSCSTKMVKQYFWMTRMSPHS